MGKQSAKAPLANGVLRRDRFVDFVRDWAHSYASVNKIDVQPILVNVTERNSCFARRVQKFSHAGVRGK